MKILVVYYSLEGNTHYLAEGIAECLDADLLRLMPVKDIKNNKAKYFFGGRQASMRSKPKLESYTIIPEEYDLIIIGTPVWASTMTPAVRSFLSRSKFTGKKIGLFCCCRGNQGKAIMQMKELIEGNEILGTIDFREPIKDVLNKKEKACKWAQSLFETTQAV
jgi:flavodoxin